LPKHLLALAIFFVGSLYRFLFLFSVARATVAGLVLGTGLARCRKSAAPSGFPKEHSPKREAK
jgi:hypothetical protein